MRIRPILPLAFVALLPACSADRLPTGIEAVDDGLSAAVTRTIRGSCTTTFPAAPLPLPSVLEQTDHGVCRLSHLGRSQYVTVKEIHFATGTQVTTELRISAANGDVLFGTGIGQNSPAGPGLIGFSAVMTISGGTGRFAGAAGTLDVSGVANLATNSASVTIEGDVAW